MFYPWTLGILENLCMRIFLVNITKRKLRKPTNCYVKQQTIVLFYSMQIFNPQSEKSIEIFQPVIFRKLKNPRTPALMLFYEFN